MMKQRLAIAGLVAALVGGGVAGVVFVPSLVGAQDDATTTTTEKASTTTTEADDTTTTEASDETTTTEADDSTTTTAPSTDDDADEDAKDGGDRTQHLQDALTPLVANGTITQAQADAVIEALKAAGPPDGGHRGHGHHGFGFGFGRFGDLDTIASALGITTDELRTALEDGQSIKDLAAAKGVDVQKVIDAVVAEVKTKVDEQVAAGRITQDEADRIVLRTADALTSFVNGELPRFPGHFDAPDAPEGD
jgi:hypothetical protein